MDIIYLHDLEIDCVLGIWDWERRTTQTVTFDLDMAADVRKAAASDRIEDTIDYKAVAKRLATYVGASKFQLVETLAEKVAELILNEFPIRWIRLQVNKKGAVRGAAGVGVIIERGEKPKNLYQ